MSIYFYPITFNDTPLSLKRVRQRHYCYKPTKQHRERDTSVQYPNFIASFHLQIPNVRSSSTCDRRGRPESRVLHGSTTADRPANVPHLAGEVRARNQNHERVPQTSQRRQGIQTVRRWRRCRLEQLRLPHGTDGERQGSTRRWRFPFEILVLRQRFTAACVLTKLLSLEHDLCIIRANLFITRGK